MLFLLGILAVLVFIIWLYVVKEVISAWAEVKQANSQ